MNKTLSAAITAMLLVTSSAWGASPEGQAVRPMGDNMPDKSPSERAEEMRENRADERRGGQQGERMRDEHRREDRHSDDRRQDGHREDKHGGSEQKFKKQTE